MKKTRIYSKWKFMVVIWFVVFAIMLTIVPPGVDSRAISPTLEVISFSDDLTSNDEGYSYDTAYENDSTTPQNVVVYQEHTGISFMGAAVGPPIGTVMWNNAYNSRFAAANSDDVFDTSSAMADFTDTDIIDFFHVTGFSANNATAVPTGNRKAGANMLTVTASHPFGRGTYTDVGLFAPWYTDGTPNDQPTPAMRRTVGQVHIGTTVTIPQFVNTWVEFTAPSVYGETRTLEIYIGVGNGRIGVTATMGDESIDEVTELASVAQNQQYAKYAFTFTGTSDEAPLVVRFTGAEANAAWSDIRIGGAALREGLPPQLNNITVQSAANGAVTANAGQRISGSYVALTVAPEYGYRLDTLRLNGVNVAADVGANGLLSFRVSEDVVVTASFVEVRPDTGGVVKVFNPEKDATQTTWLRRLDSEYAGRPTIDDNFSAPNVVDWIRLTGENNVNRRDFGEDPPSQRIGFTTTNNRGTDTHQWRRDVRITYANGVEPTGDSSSFSTILTGGIIRSGTISAPSVYGVERQLDIYISYNSNIQLAVNYSMGSITMPVVNSGLELGNNRVARLSFTYTGSQTEYPLEVTVSAIGTDLSFYGARIMEGSGEEHIAMTIPDMEGLRHSRYAVHVPTSLFNRRNIQVRTFDEFGAAGDVVDPANITFSYVGVYPPNVAGSSDIPGLSVENGMLYVRSNVEQTTTIDITAETDVGGQSQAVTRRFLIIRNPNFRDQPAPSSDAPMGQEANDWVLFFADEFNYDELDTTVWSPYYLRSWEGDPPGRSLSQHEIVRDEHDNGYLVLTSSDDMTTWSQGINATKNDHDGTHRVSSLSSFERQHLHLMDPSRAFYDEYTIPVFDGRDINTKYGFFEIRMRLPNTGDGSHFAWWMVGVQDDAHPSATYAGPMPANARVLPGNNFRFPDDGRAWGVLDSFFTDQGTEFDIVESTLDINSPSGSSPYNGWLPVIHSNGSRHVSQRWFAGVDVPINPTPNSPFGRYRFPNHVDDDFPHGRDAYHQFHVYGFEWDENGTRFFVDGQLVYASMTTTHFRMMHFLSIYTGTVHPAGWNYGFDHGHYPKEAFIDYIRVWKRDEAPRPNDVIINNQWNTAWDWLQVPAEGVNEVQLTATVLDQFDQPFELREGESLRWRLSSNVGGASSLYPFAIRTTGNGARPVPEWWNAENVNANRLNSITLDPVTGVVSIPAGTQLDKDLFITAYVYGVDAATDPTFNTRRVRHTKHVQLRDDAPEPTLVVFVDPQQRTIAPGESVTLNAKVFDQYMNEMPEETARLIFSFTETIQGAARVSPTGLSLNGNVVTATSMADANSFFVISAHIPGGDPRTHYQALPMQVVADPQQPPPPPVVEFTGTNPARLNEQLQTNNVILSTRSNLGVFANHDPLVVPTGRILTVETALNIHRGGELIVEGTLVISASGRLNNQGGNQDVFSSITIAPGGKLIVEGWVESVSGSRFTSAGNIIIKDTGRINIRGNVRFCLERCGTVTVNDSGIFNINRDAIKLTSCTD
ncbi:MAG: glycoside hydrolase family 16 protein [Oscillospiraceae bacterium]|nr:glycoside hydrolase family 16 protein [Oscillospiraceae bacterium]